MALLLMLALLLAGCSSSGQGQKKEAPKAGSKAENRMVRLAIQPSAAFVPLVIAREKGWIDEAMKGIGVSVKWTDFESGPPMNESFAAGQQDIGVIGDVPSVAAVAAGQKNVFIAAADGGPSYAMLVTDDSGIKNVADLKGKKIGLTIGSTAQNLAGKLLAKAGLDIKKDVEIINVNCPGLMVSSLTCPNGSRWISSPAASFSAMISSIAAPSEMKMLTLPISSMIARRRCASASKSTDISGKYTA